LSDLHTKPRGFFFTFEFCLFHMSRAENYRFLLLSSLYTCPQFMCITGTRCDFSMLRNTCFVYLKCYPNLNTTRVLLHVLALDRLYPYQTTSCYSSELFLSPSALPTCTRKKCFIETITRNSLYNLTRSEKTNHKYSLLTAPLKEKRQL